MSAFDYFASKDGQRTAQLKCFHNECIRYEIGDDVPVVDFGFPMTCTFCDFGGVSKKFEAENILGEKESMGTFVIIILGKLVEVTYDEKKVVEPVYSKYGETMIEVKKKK